MTPILGARSGSPEEYYSSHVRNTVEWCIGVLKARWRCLLAHRVLHYSPLTAGKIVNACVVLHNIANASNIPIPELQGEDINHDRQHQIFHEAARAEPAPEVARHLLVHRLWDGRLL